MLLCQRRSLHGKAMWTDGGVDGSAGSSLGDRVEESGGGHKEERREEERDR